MNLINTSIIACSAYLLCSCAGPLHNLTELKQQAAKDIAVDAQLSTAWVGIQELNAGTIYYAKKPPGGPFSVRSTFLTDQADAEGKKCEWLKLGPANPTWSYLVTSGGGIKAQLTYLGLSGLIDANSVKTISFTAETESYRYVNEWSVMEDKLSAAFEPNHYLHSLLKDIQRDSADLTVSKSTSSYAHYVICTEALNVKNMKITFKGTKTFNLSVSGLQAALKTFFAADGLPDGSFSVNYSSDDESTFTITAKSGVAATLCPIIVDKSGTVFPDVLNDRIQ